MLDRYSHNSQRTEAEFKKTRPIFTLAIDEKTHKKKLVKVSDFNFYDKIQEYAPETDINNIILKAQNGLLKAEDLAMKDSQVGDLTKIKYKSLADLKKESSNVDQLYNALPDDLKSSYKDVNDFMSRITDEIIQKYVSEKLNVSKEVKDV